MFKIFKAILLLTTLCTILVSGNITASANLTIAPYNADRSDKLEKDWFVFSIKAGDTINDALILNNSFTFDTTADLSAKDAVTTDEGNFTILADQDPNKAVGNWIKLAVDQILIPQTGSIKIPFQIDIPKETKDGEYAAGFAITTQGQSQDTVKIAIRKGVRVYLAVGQDFTLASKIQDLNIVDPSDPDFGQIKSEKSFFGKDNLLLEFQAQNTGNIFGVLDCKYALNYGDGTIYESVFTTEITPRSKALKYYIITNQPYKTGTTTAILDCQNQVQNIDPKRVKFENQKAVISNELVLNQTQLEAFEPSRNPAFTRANLEKNPAQDTKDDINILSSTKNNSFEMFYILGAVVVLILVAALGAVYFHKRKKKN